MAAEYLYRVLNNPVIIGDAVHKGVAYPGEHPPIIDRKLWGQVRSIMQASPRVRGNRTRARTPALLKGLIFGPTGLAMTPTHTSAARQALSLLRLHVGFEAGPGDMSDRIGAAEIEGAVVEQVRTLLVCPEVIVKTWRELRKSIKDLSEAANSS